MTSIIVVTSLGSRVKRATYVVNFHVEVGEEIDGILYKGTYYFSHENKTERAKESL